MSRIRALEARVQTGALHVRNNFIENVKTKTDSSSDEYDQQQMKELAAKLPKLDKIFQLHHKIGVGTFSSVYLGSLRLDHTVPKEERRWFAIKHLVPNTHPARVEHELRCLQEMGGKDNIIGVELCLRQDDTIVFVMPYISHKKFSDYVWLMDANELREYMRALLVALRRVHSFGVIHRDVKPSNFLYDRENKRYLLVDFGLAQRLTAPSAPPASVPPPPPPPAHSTNLRKRPREDSEAVTSPELKRLALDLSVQNKCPPPSPHRAPAPVPAPAPALPPRAPATLAAHPLTEIKRPGRGAGGVCACWGAGAVCARCATLPAARACRAGTGGFRPPEVLLKCADQGTKVDTWAAGVVLCSALSGRYPFFRGVDDASALAELAALLGTAPLQRAAATLGRRLVMSRVHRGLCLRKLCARLRGAGPSSTPAPTPALTPAAPLCPDCRLALPHCLCLPFDKPADAISAGESVAGFPDSAFALAARLLDPDPATRASAADALAHPFFTATH